jgi:hypothetical protein
MSLRNPHDPHDKRDKDFDNLPAYVSKGHALKQYAFNRFGCSCLMVFSNARTVRDANFALATHKKALVEAIEDSRKGIPHYDSDQ